MNSAKKPWYKKWWLVVLFIIIALILILAVASAFYINDEIKRIKNNSLNNLNYSVFNNSQYTEQMKALIEGQDNYWLGSAKPTVTIVEFSDFACPHCKNAFPKIREISLRYKNDVKIIFRDYPLRENSQDLALAAYCAGEQGLFWLMHDKLFQNQGIYEKPQLAELAKQAGADTDKFDNCFSEKKYLDRIKKNLADGEKLKISGTPAWFINGQKIEGDIPYDIFIKIIEDIIKNQ